MLKVAINADHKLALQKEARLSKPDKGKLKTVDEINVWIKEEKHTKYTTTNQQDSVWISTIGNKCWGK